MLHKIEKAAVGYTYHADTDYHCWECVFIKPLGTAQFKPNREFAAGCAFFGPNDPISATRGGCNAFIHGDSTKFDVPWLALCTKEELGYAENRAGFTCGRCEHMDVQNSDCEKVDKDSPGDTPGEINLRACCNAWEKDSKRGEMSAPVLLEYVAGQNRKDPARAANLEEYESRRKVQGDE